MLRGEDFGARSRELAALITSLSASNDLRAPLGEMYPVSGGADATPLLQVDRSAVTWFGVRAFGVHLNGYVRTRGELCLWVAVRARDKRTFPGHLDNMVAGGQPIGFTPLQTLVKECDEEAGVGDDLAASAVPIGAISYVQQDRLSLKSDTLACFDLELPAAFVPRPADGEVEEFALWPAVKVAESLRNGTPWKPNSAMVTLDFLLRFGCLDVELQSSVEPGRRVFCRQRSDPVMDVSDDTHRAGWGTACPGGNLCAARWRPAGDSGAHQIPGDPVAMWNWCVRRS